jgi:hypothetical protein
MPAPNSAHEVELVVHGRRGAEEAHVLAVGADAEIETLVAGREDGVELARRVGVERGGVELEGLLRLSVAG